MTLLLRRGPVSRHLAPSRRNRDDAIPDL